MLRALRLLVAALAAVSAAEPGFSSQPEGGTQPYFNKDDMEALLKKEHSQRISNVYDSKNGVQCVPRHSSARLPPHIFLSTSLFLSQVHVEHREAGALPGRRRRMRQGGAVIGVFS